jgi:hypothetical protein
MKNTICPFERTIESKQSRRPRIAFEKFVAKLIQCKYICTYDHSEGGAQDERMAQMVTSTFYFDFSFAVVKSSVRSGVV